MISQTHCSESEKSSLVLTLDATECSNRNNDKDSQRLRPFWSVNIQTHYHPFILPEEPGANASYSTTYLLLSITT